MSASYPTSVKSFTTKNPGDTIQSVHVDDLQDEVAAIEQDLITGLPVARGGTGLTAIGTVGQVLGSTGSVAIWQDANTKPTEQTSTDTGAVNNFSLTAPFTFLRCTGAAPIFSGFTVDGAAPVGGCRVLIECLGTTLRVTTQDTNSTDVNRVICASANGQIVGVNGLILAVYDDTTDRWRATVLDPGAPITPAFSAGDYTTDTGTWTVASGDVGAFVYQQRGKTVWVSYLINTTTVATTPNLLRIAIPGGFTATKTTYGGLHRFVDNGTAAVGFSRVNASATVIENGRQDGAAFANATDNTYVWAQITFEVN